MNTNLGEIKRKIEEFGSGPGCTGHVIEENGFKISGLVSKDENFLGVNIGETESSWDNHNIKYTIVLSRDGEVIACDRRKMTVSQLRSCGSLGVFYNPSHKNNLVENYNLILEIEVYIESKTQFQQTQSSVITSLNDPLVVNAPLLAYYFSAHWCPPCRGFTPKLTEFYNTVNADGKRIEIVFCSWDNDEDSFKEYFSEMPWLALNLGNEKINEIANANSVESIPKLLLVKKGQVVNTEARNEVAACSNSSDYLALINQWSV
jgi:thiol-disulfide isomerase/thioredoxin